MDGSGNHSHIVIHQPWVGLDLCVPSWLNAFAFPITDFLIRVISVDQW
jgi:hypothetical protein